AHAVRHRIDEARVVLARELAQVDRRPLGLGHAVAVAGGAVRGEEVGAFRDLGGGEGLGGRARAPERQQQKQILRWAQDDTRFDDDTYSISAKVHTEPPAGTMSLIRRPATLPPRPESTVTYWRPLCI